MPVYEFAVTVPTTMTAQVSVEADTIEEAMALAVAPSFVNDPSKATFELDEGNPLRDAYVADENDYSVAGSPKP